MASMDSIILPKNQIVARGRIFWRRTGGNIIGAKVVGEREIGRIKCGERGDGQRASPRNNPLQALHAETGRLGPYVSDHSSTW